MKLTQNTVGSYLAGHGIVDQESTVVVRELGGGVSNVVLEVAAEDDRMVVKQPLGNLDVEDDWPAEVERVHNEAAAARAYRDAIPDDTPVRIPSIRFEDTEHHVIVMDAAPRDATMWKADLLDGIVHPRIASRVGNVLGTVQSAVTDDEGLRAKFADETPFIQLRIDPYHRTVARRHPDLAESIKSEIDRILDIRRTLVHGDYSPKNILVNHGSPPELWVLDFEVAHWGDPAFDPAFMLNHLFIKSVYNADKQATYHDAAMSFWNAYDEAVEWDVSEAVVRELGILMLARVDGKSPVEYLTKESVKNELRAIARRTIENPPSGIQGFKKLVATPS